MKSGRVLCVLFWAFRRDMMEEVSRGMAGVFEMAFIEPGVVCQK